MTARIYPLNYDTKTFLGGGGSKKGAV